MEEGMKENEKWWHTAEASLPLPSSFPLSFGNNFSLSSALIEDGQLLWLAYPSSPPHTKNVSCFSSLSHFPTLISSSSSAASPSSSFQCSEFLSNVSMAWVGGRQRHLKKPRLRFAAVWESAKGRRSKQEWLRECVCWQFGNEHLMWTETHC